MPAREVVSLEFVGESAGAQRAARQTVGAIKEVEHQSRHTSGAMKRHAEESVAANALLTGSFTRMASRAVAAGAAFTAAYIGIAKAKDAISATIELAHATELLHRNLGLSVKTASGLESVLKARGIDANSAAMAFQTLSRQVLAAETGSKKTEAAFLALGISVKDLKAAHGDLNVLLPRIAEGFGNLKGGAERAAVAQALMARGYKSLLPLFADGKRGFEEQIATADKFGAVLSENTLRQLDRLHAAQIKNREASLGLKIAFTEAATPALLHMSELTQKLARDFQGPGSLDDKMSKVGHDLGPALSSVEHTLEAAIPQIANHVGRDAPKVALAFVHGFENADIWGQLALGAFFVKAMGGWKKLFAVAGFADAVAWGKGFTPTAEAEASATGETAGRRYSAAFRKFMLVGIAAGLTVDLYHNLVGPFNQAIQDLTGQINATDPTNGKGQQRADQYAGAGGHGNVLGLTPGSTLQNGLPTLGKAPGGSARLATIMAAAFKYGIDPKILWGIYGAESSFGKAKSSFGLTGDYPGTGTSGNFSKDAYRSAQILHNLIGKTGSLDAALRKYSGGSYGLGHIDDILGGHPAGGGGGGGKPKSYLDYLNALTGKKGKPVPGDLAWARTMVGHFKESAGANSGPELDKLQKEFGTHAAAWCAEFATKALVKAGFPKAVMTSSVSTLNAWAKAHNYGLGFTGSPKPGDLMTLGNRHVAIVESVDRAKGIVHTIAGNTGKGEVSRSTYSLGAGKYISVNAARGGTNPDRSGIYTVPRLNVNDSIQAQLQHFDLMAGAGLISQGKADAQKRNFLRGMLPNLTGDSRLQALGQIRSLAPPPGGIATGAAVLSQRDDRAVAFQQMLRSSGIDASSQHGLGLTSGYLAHRLLEDQSARAPLQDALAKANKAGNKDLAANIRQSIKDVNADIAETSTQIAENTRATADAVKAAAEQARQDAITGVMNKAGAGSSIAQIMQTKAGPGLLAQFFPGTDFSQFATPGGLNDYLKGLIPGLIAQGDFPDAVSLIGQIASNTDAIAQNTADLSDFWKTRALAMTQAYQISQSQYGVFAGTKTGAMPFLGGFDAGGPIPLAPGKPGLAVVHGGEYVQPRGQTAVAPVHIHVSAEAAALGVKVDHYQGRRARQLSVAPGH